MLKYQLVKIDSIYLYIYPPWIHVYMLFSRPPDKYWHKYSLVSALWPEMSPRFQVISEVPCFPFYSIMLALNQTRVDYFSLDVEGFELDILRTIPYDKIDITMFSVEFVHGREGGQAYLDYMKSKGYRMEKELHEHNQALAINLDDYIFVKN